MIVIRLPLLPDRRLGQNAKQGQHWSIASRLRDEVKATVVGACMEARQRWEKEQGRCWKPISGPANVSVTVYYNGRTRPMDKINTLVCLKAHFDAMQTAKTMMYSRRRGQKAMPRIVGGGDIIENDKDLNPVGVEWIRTTDVPPETVITITEK
ncbi:MAG: hypothetical protein PHQ43_00085 [Dehalococcoidales bacterium]|nr:hypothetical protein [Dehalococcoidales bacterium]